MTSFQLVNQKLKHIFGGLQPQLNFSVENLNAEHKKISNYLNTSSILYKKIHQAASIIKQSTAEILQLHKNSLKDCKSSKLSDFSNIESIVQDVSKTWGNLGQQVFQIKRRVDMLLQNFLPSIKKHYNQHKQAAQQLEHYKQKVQLLQKRVTQNSDSEQQTRYQRNQQKLKNSQETYNKIVEKITNKYTEFNNDGKKLLMSNYSDFLIVFVRNNEDLRLSVNSWLRTKDKKCVCDYSNIIKTKIRNTFAGQKEDMENKPTEPLCIDRFFKKMDGFKHFKNAFQQPLETRSSRRTVGVQSFNLIEANQNQELQRGNKKQRSMRKHSQNAYQQANTISKNGFHGGDKKTKKQQSLQTKVQAAKKVLNKNPSQKPQFKDFLDLMNM